MSLRIRQHGLGWMWLHPLCSRNWGFFTFVGGGFGLDLGRFMAWVV